MTKVKKLMKRYYEELYIKGGANRNSSGYQVQKDFHKTHIAGFLGSTKLGGARPGSKHMVQRNVP